MAGQQDQEACHLMADLAQRNPIQGQQKASRKKEERRPKEELSLLYQILDVEEKK
jgi:hypothetical protein